jgi:F0F1-type ATP synthase assembly protein I
MPPGDDDGRKRRQMQWLVEASSIGWVFPIAIAVGFLSGYGLDKLFGTWPWLTAIFSVFGAVAAFIHLFRVGMGDDGSSR